MHATSPLPRVLVIGLDPYRVPGPWDPTPVADAIEVGIARFAEHGVGVQACLVGLDGSDDIAAVVTDALCARSWECVVIGGGIRTAEDQVHLFEQVINLVRRHAADAAIAFNREAHAGLTVGEQRESLLEDTSRAFAALRHRHSVRRNAWPLAADTALRAPLLNASPRPRARQRTDGGIAA